VPAAVGSQAVGEGARAAGSMGRNGIQWRRSPAEAGQTFIVSVRSPDFDTHVKVLGPAARDIANDDSPGEGSDSPLSVRLPADSD